MIQKMKSYFLIAIFISFIFVMIGCSDNTDGQGDQNNNPPISSETPDGNKDNNDESNINEVDKEPIEISVGVIWDEDMFYDRLKGPIEDKFPYITLKYEHVDHFNRGSLEEMFSGGISPDFFFTISHEDMEYFRIDQDLTDLLEKYNVSTDNINPALLEAIRARDKEGRLLAWPYEDTSYVIMYNKDIFDIFGVEYPSDDLTWEELINLSRRMTEERDGVQYRGLDIREEVMLSQLSVNATDPETGEVQILNNDAFSKVVNMYKMFFDTIPSDYEGDIFTDHRFIERETAMVVTNSQAINWRKDDGINYDLAAVPTWEHKPGIGPRGFLHTFTLNPDTEYEEDVIKIFEYLASDEYQEWMSRNGVGIVTNNKELQKLFYADLEGTEGKNIEAIFKNETASPPERISRWDQYVSLDLQRLYESNMDTNEFLRIIAEESEIKIKDAMEAQ